MEKITVFIPAWIEALPKNERGRERSRFILRLAAVLGTEGGTLAALSKRLGYNPNSVATMLYNGHLDRGITIKMMKAIEALIGRGTIPREIMNPGNYGENEL